MKAIQVLKEIEEILSKAKITYRIINTNDGNNLILLDKTNKKLNEELEKYKKYIQEIIIEKENKEDDKDFIKRIKDLCNKNESIHRNTSYISWNRTLEKEKIKIKIKNVISGYSFKGGMGRSSTLAYLAYFYYFMGKDVVVIDSDFEAPGIASMFFNKRIRQEKGGVLDYIVDLKIEDNLKLKDYYQRLGDSKNNGSMKLFPSGIDYDISNYINKISKIDFNSSSYNESFTKLITKINNELKPDLIFIDLRAGINESNGFVLNNLSNMSFLFFNSEEQNQDGLEAILSSLKSDNYNIVNSTIRYRDKDIKEEKEKEFRKFIENRDLPFVNVGYIQKILDGDIEEFTQDESNNYSNNGNYIYKDIIDIITKEYFPLDKQKKINSEIKKLEKLIKSNPKDDEAYYNMGIAYNNKQDYDKAIECYKKSLELNPKKDEAYYNMGVAYIMKEDYKKAIIQYEKAKEINPNNNQASNMINFAKNKLSKK
jgi:tetratricopeptide (TPR) repeat protein